jgi:hypothetical protein
MATTIRPVEYFYATVQDDVGTAALVLNQLEELGVNLLAFTAVPNGSSSMQFTIVPDDPGKLTAEAALAQQPLDGPHYAVLVQGDDQLGALADVHRRLLAANVDIYASSGVSDGRGAFGYVVFVREDQFSVAVEALGVPESTLHLA